MAKVLYTAKDRHGKPIQGFVEAASVHEARDQLINGGMTDVVLHQDPILGARWPTPPT
jgi:type II secretory pathway component PulF